jgi:cytochrome c oxidase subunit 4
MQQTDSGSPLGGVRNDKEQPWGQRKGSIGICQWRTIMNREILKQAARTPALALLGLLALLAINIGLAYAPIGQHLRLPVKLTICFGMAFTLMVFCMHLHRATGLLRLAAATGFAWLAIMIGLMLTDYFTRVPVPPPW